MLREHAPVRPNGAPFTFSRRRSETQTRLCAVTALMGLDARLRLARLQLVTDTRGGGRAFGDYCVEVFRHGVDMLQVRERGISAVQLTDALEIARSVALQLNKLVVVSEDVDVAAAFGADVIQLDATAAAAEAKSAQHPYALVGVAAHDEAGLAAAATNEAVSYLTVGPVFGGGDRPVYALPGLDLVRAAADTLAVADSGGKPWFAIGGIDAASLDDVIAAGARRVVVTGRALGSQDPGDAVRTLSARLREAWDADESLAGYAFRVLGGGTGQLKP